MAEGTRFLLLLETAVIDYSNNARALSYNGQEKTESAIRATQVRLGAPKKEVTPAFVSEAPSYNSAGSREKEEKETVREVAKASTALYFQYNTQLGPPYHIIIDTNFIHFSIKNKIDLFQGTVDCLYAECKLYITDCVMGELEKLGTKYRVGLKIAKHPKIQRLPCTHRGIYADDCICNRVTQHKCYIVATCDRDLRRRIRKIPGVPIMYIMARKYTIERLPEATMGGAPRV